MMSVIKKGGIFFLISVFLINFVSAQYYFNLEYFLDNDIIRFALIFLFIFAIVMFSLNRTTFRENKAVSVVISFVIAFFASAFLFRSRYLSNFLADDMIGLIAVLIFIFLLFLLCWLGWKYLKCIGVISVLIIAWFFLRAIDIKDYITGGGFGDFVLSLYDIYTNNITIYILAIAFLICILMRFGLLGGGGRPPGPSPPPPTPPPPPIGNTTIQLLSPNIGARLPAGSQIPFRFRFVNAPANFQDRVTVFLSLNGEGYKGIASTRSGIEGEIILSIPNVNDETRLDIGIVARDNRVSGRFGPFTIIPPIPPKPGKGRIELSPGGNRGYLSENVAVFQYKFFDVPNDFKDNLVVFSRIDGEPRKRLKLVSGGKGVDSVEVAVEGEISLVIPKSDKEVKFWIYPFATKNKITGEFGPYSISPGDIPVGKIGIELLSPAAGTSFASEDSVNFKIRFVNAPASFKEIVIYYDNIDTGVFTSMNEFESGFEGQISRKLPRVDKETKFYIGFSMKDERLQEEITSVKFGPFYIGPKEISSHEIDIELLSPSIGSRLPAGSQIPFRFRFLNVLDDFKDSVQLYVSDSSGSFKYDGFYELRKEGEILLNLPDVEIETSFQIALVSRKNKISKRFGPFYIEPKETPVPPLPEKEIILLYPSQSEALIGGKNQPFDFEFKNYNSLEISKIAVYYKLLGGEKLVPCGRISPNMGGNPELGNITFLLPEVDSETKFAIVLSSEISNSFLKRFEFKIIPGGEKGGSGEGEKEDGEDEGGEDEGGGEKDEDKKNKIERRDSDFYLSQSEDFIINYRGGQKEISFVVGNKGGGSFGVTLHAIPTYLDLSIDEMWNAKGKRRINKRENPLRFNLAAETHARITLSLDEEKLQQAINNYRKDNGGEVPSEMTGAVGVITPHRKRGKGRMGLRVKIMLK